MNARMFTGLAAAGVLAFGLTVQAQQPADDAAGAQAGPQAPQGQSQAPMADSAARPAGAVTVEGCIERGDEAAGGAAGAESFKLASAEAAEGAAGAAGAAGAEIEDEYTLSASGDVNLSQHVDHQVRVTGTVAAAGGAASGDADAPTLNVTSLEMIAATCAD